jgi:hypothetical protein
VIIEAKISGRLRCPPGGTLYGPERAVTYSAAKAISPAAVEPHPSHGCDDTRRSR